MATKIVHTVQVVITKDIASNEVTASCRALCFSPDIGARFDVNLAVEPDSVDGIMTSAVEALKGNLAEGGHTVLDAEPEPES
tara:strand:+ start:125 stop:370 length:246 start_codon:yes stop_codon:yes gene_type:complete